jgi:hypothetical protein
MRTGDFSELLGAPTLDYNQSIPVSQYIQLYNTTNGLAAAVRLCEHVWQSASGRNPVAQYVFAHPEFYPLPNRPSTNVNSPDTNNYGGYNKSAYVNNQGDIRVDYNPTTKDNLWARYSHGIAYDEPIVAVLAFEFPGSNDYPFWNGVLNEVHTFSSNLQNEFRAGYSRVDDLSGVPFDSTGQFPAGSDPKVGYPYASPYPASQNRTSPPLKRTSALWVCAELHRQHLRLWRYRDLAARQAHHQGWRTDSALPGELLLRRQQRHHGRVRLQRHLHQGFQR